MFVIKRKNIIIVAVLIITAITFITCFGAISSKTVSDSLSNKIKIVLDAGHGGIDGGVVGVSTGVKESELNLKVVKKLEKFLVDAGFFVVLTRSTDAGLYGIATTNLKRKDMEKRREIIRKTSPDLVVSVHMNKYSLASRRGAQVFYKKNDERGKLLAESIQYSFNQMEQSVRICNALTGDYYILNCSEYPSVIAECGFLSNIEDEALLITKEYQEDVAYSIYKGIAGYLAQSSFSCEH